MDECFTTEYLYILFVRFGKTARIALVMWRLTQTYGNWHDRGLHVQQSEREAVDIWAFVNCGGTQLNIETYSCAFLVVLER